MKIINKTLAILLGISILLIGCSSNEVTPQENQGSKAVVENEIAMLYTNMSAGFKSDFKTHPFEYTGDLTVEKLAQGLSELTGLDFYITTQDPNDNLKEITIDWDQNSTLIANLDDREQKDDFFLFDEDSMRWFMLDSLWYTVIENLDYENVYYTMNGGCNLEFDNLYPIKEFPSNIIYMGSAFYYAHADTHNGEILSEEDAFALAEDIMQERGDFSTVILSDGEEIIDGEHAYIFSTGDYSEDGQKFTAMYHYAVSDRGNIYYLDVLSGADWILNNNETSSKVDFSVFTDISSAEVESFVEGVQYDLINEEWTSLASKISYPIDIGSKTFETEDEFAIYDIGSLLSDDCKTFIAQTDCTNLFANYEGVMIANGKIWITEIFNEDMSSRGLKVYVWNP
ncbi:MAG: hypothetical protein RBR71_05045 [Gudongella sp.]|nr:hypothetical protein [Gudongella sp.]